MSAKKKKADDRYKEIRNAKANHNYFVGERFEAGIELLGTEVKAIRMGNAQLGESFCRIDKGQVWLFNSHIGHYEFGNFANHEPRRKRKLRDQPQAHLRGAAGLQPLRDAPQQAVPG